MTRAGQRNGTKAPAYTQRTLPALNTDLPALFTKREEWHQPSFSMSMPKPLAHTDLRYIISL